MLKFLYLVFAFQIICGLSHAETNSHFRKRHHRPRCNTNVAMTTTYFVPHIKDYCPDATPCPKFIREVNMQGTGTLMDNKVLRYNGKTESLGKCSTAIGAAGKCLLPYFSIAADPRFYRMGDIISMPSMRGQIVTLPSGKKIEHPGYFIVQDTGGGVKGQNRFDFFTGSMGYLNPLNSFGANAPKTSLSAKYQCSARKQFSVIRRGTETYTQTLAMIDQAGGSGSPGSKLSAPILASAEKGSVQ